MDIRISAYVSTPNFNAHVQPDGVVRINAIHDNIMRNNNGAMCVNDIVLELMKLQEGINKCK